MNVPASCIVAISRCCARLQFAAVEIPAKRNEIADKIADLYREGYRIETWDSERVRRAQWFCECSGAAIPSAADTPVQRQDERQDEK